ncbi:EAL domain-containing protein [Variovorax sp. HJSM1_2]|uniref:EAL domain-containing protein n=1 Tax=Variovorax sp. HJSM1_2 TaxID=3366263 RepID=UPI003BD8AE19
MVDKGEQQRLDALRRYAVLDTSPEVEFDKLTKLAAGICEVPIAMVSLVDEQRQWFKSSVGLSVRETERTVSFCSHAIQGHGAFVVPNAAIDARFADNPLVTGEPRIRFYACFPLVTSDGYALGTLAVIDQVPRVLSAAQLSALETLADQVMVQLEYRHQRLAMQAWTAEREQLLLTLQQNSEILQIAGQVARVGGWLADLRQGTVFWSPEVAAIHETEVQTFAVDQAHGFYAPEYRERLLARFRACANDGVSFDEEMELVTARGNRVWVRTIGQPGRRQGQHIVQIKGALQDITERKLAEQSLSASQRRFRELADAMPQIVWTARPDGTVDYANKAMFNYVDITPRGTAEIGWVEALHPEDVAPTLAIWTQAVQTGQAVSLEYRLKRASDRQYRWMLVKAEPVRDDEGAIVNWYGTVTDIHDHKLAEQQASALSRRLATTLESITDGFFTVDNDWRFTYVNPEAERLLQQRQADILGCVIWDVFGASTGSVFYHEYQRAMATRQTVGFEAWSLVRHCWFEVRAYPSDEGLSVYFRDATERHQSNERLRISEERFQIVAKATAGAVWDWNFQTGHIWRNEGFQKLYGDSAELADDSVGSWADRVHPEDRERVLGSIYAVIHGAESNWEDSFRFRRNDGSYADVMDRGIVIRDALGAAIRMVGGMVDITERKRAEEAARREERARASIVKTQQEIASASLDLNALMTLVAERAKDLVSATGGEVELIDGEDMVCRGAAGPTTRRVGQRFTREGSFSGLALARGEVLRCDDAEADPRVNLAICREVGIRSLLVAPLRVGNTPIGVVKVVSPQTFAFGMREVDHLQILVESMGVVIERQRFAERLERSAAQYRMLFESSPLPMWVYDSGSLRLLAVNQASLALYGYSREEFQDMPVQALWAPGVELEYDGLVKAVPLQPKTFGQLRRHRKKNGDIIDVEIAADAIEFAGQAARLVLVYDVTKRLLAERELLRVSRAQKMLSACNESLIRAEDAQRLLEQICRITVAIGGYRMAWVGLALEDERKSIQPVASFGEGTGFLENLTLSWSSEQPLQMGSVGRAFATRQVVVVEDIAQDDLVRLWRDAALAHGLRAVISLPLVNRDQILGVLVLYSPEVNHVPKDELVLLEELANDLAFGIGNLRAQDEQRRLQASLRKIASAVSTQSGKDFFAELALNMAESLGAYAGFIARVETGGASARVIAGAVDGRATGGFAFPLQGTPCAKLLTEPRCVVPRQVGPLLAELVPLAQHLGNLPAQDLGEGFVGLRLASATGDVLGMLFVLFRAPLDETDAIFSTLQIFAARAEGELQRLESDAQLQDQASLLNRAQDAIMVRGMDHSVIFWNHSAERLYGWRAEEAIGRSIASLLYADTVDFLRATQVVISSGEWTGEIEQRRKDGSSITVEGRWTLVRDDAGAPKSILAINTDISERKKSEHAVHRLAFYDPLTGLPNRLLLSDRLNHAITQSARTQQRGALFFIDLDNFKTLNDTLGHDKGDELLVQVARRLLECVRESDTVARLGGDEFLVMLEGLSEDAAQAIEQARAVGEKMLTVLDQPYTLSGYQHRCTSSIGVAPFLGHDVSVGELLKRSDLAMYQAKDAGRNTLRFFDPQMQEAVFARAGMESDLRQALVNHEFLLHYQPQANMQGQVTGVEALIRWMHPVRGLVSPALFIPAAEESDLILQVGQWVLETACQQLASWRATPGLCELTMSVNVSAKQFHHPHFVVQVLDALQRTQAAPHKLKLELTESVLADDMPSLVHKMSQLQEAGVGFSLDDFGTGYSSLAYLKRLPLDQLKIDQSFVRDVLTDPNDAAIARTIVALGQSLALNVVAEGVETVEQRRFLVECGCHGFQGYLLSRPLPAPALASFLAQAMA